METVAQTRGRNPIYDRAKGIGIVLLILGHLVTISSPLFCAIFAFHMPLFLFVSGLFYHPLCTKADIINKHIVRHIIPFVFFSVLGLLITIIISYAINPPLSLIPKGNVIRCWMIESVISLGSKSCLMASLWYLPVFSASLLLLDFSTWLQRKKVVFNNTVLFLIFAFLAVSMSILRGEVRLPLRTMTLFGTTLFVFCGFLSRNGIMEYVKQLTNWKVLLLLFLFVLIVSVNGYVNISTPIYNNPVLFFTAAVIGIVLTLYVSQFKFLSFLEFYGRHSLIIFCMNSLWCEVYCMILSKITGIQYIAMGNVPLHFALLGTLFVLLISIPTFYIINPVLKRLNRIITK